MVSTIIHDKRISIILLRLYDMYEMVIMWWVCFSELLKLSATQKIHGSYSYLLFMIICCLLWELSKERTLWSTSWLHEGGAIWAIFLCLRVMKYLIATIKDDARCDSFVYNSSVFFFFLLFLLAVRFKSLVVATCNNEPLFQMSAIFKVLL